MGEKEKFIENALGSLDGIQPARAGSATYRKIMLRIGGEDRDISNIVPSSTVWRIAAALFVVVALNIVTCAVVSGSQPMAKNEALSVFAQEYNITGNNLNY